MYKSTADLYEGNQGWESFPQSANWKRALQFAQEKHEGQMRDEGVPYFEHILGVLQILIEEERTYDDTVLTVAALHDVLEDTDCTYEELQEEFGSTVADCVNLLTRKKDQPFEEYSKAIFTSDEFPYARKVKLADRLHNLRTLPNTRNPQKIAKKVRETEKCIIPYEPCSPRSLMQKVKDEVFALKRRPDFPKMLKTNIESQGLNR